MLLLIVGGGLTAQVGVKQIGNFRGLLLFLACVALYKLHDNFQPLIVAA